MNAAPREAHALLAQTVRSERRALLRGLAARTGRAGLAEDALGQAIVEAAESWPRTGAPDNPAGWLATAARRRLLDAIRSEQALRAAAHLLAGPAAAPGPEERLLHELPGERHDERLPQLFMVAHPELSGASRAALGLRLVLGVPTELVARLLLAPVPAVAARITRAKHRLRSRTGGLRPAPGAWPGRAPDAARILLLGFTAGSAPAGGRVLDRAASARAVRLALLAHRALPREPVLRALAALLLLQHSRRDARVDAAGRIVTLAEQDRAAWRRDEIEAGLRLLRGVPEQTTGFAEELRLQALVAAEHARAATAAETDWAAVASLYARLERLTGSPLVRLNRAIALAEAAGPYAGLALLPGVERKLPGHHRTALAAAEMLRRAGEREASGLAYRAALDASPPEAERAHILRRLAGLDEGAGAG